MEWSTPLPVSVKVHLVISNRNQPEKSLNLTELKGEWGNQISEWAILQVSVRDVFWRLVTPSLWVLSFYLSKVFMKNILLIPSGCHSGPWSCLGPWSPHSWLTHCALSQVVGGTEFCSIYTELSGPAPVPLTSYQSGNSISW